MYAKQEHAIDVLQFLSDMPGVESDHSCASGCGCRPCAGSGRQRCTPGAPTQRLQTAGALAVGLAGGLSNEAAGAIATTYGEQTAELVTEVVRFLASSPVPLSGVHWQDDLNKAYPLGPR